MDSESTAPGAPLEQALTEALLALSWPLPRTVEDADAALTRLEEVKAVLTELEQQSVGTEAWWAGQVDALATQSGFVLEWWRPVLRDPDLDWTLNHQAHLTADLATLASAGARLLDQIEPRAAEEAAEAAHARQVAQEKRWGPAAVPALAPTGPRPGAAGSRPQPPAEVFGNVAPVGPVIPVGPIVPAAPVAAAASAQPATAVGAGSGSGKDLNAPQFAPVPPAPAPSVAGSAAESGSASGVFDQDAPPVAAPPTVPAQSAAAAPVAEPIPAAAPAAVPAPPFAPVPDTSSASARHRRPTYDFDDPRGAAPASPPPRSPIVPGPGFGGPPQGRRLAPNGTYPPSEYGSGPLGFAGDDEDDEPDSLVPTGLHRHQRRLLIQTGAILGAIGVLCWWAVYTLSSPSPHSSAASGETTHTATGSANRTAAGGLTTPETSSAASTKPTASASPSAAPSTATSSVPDATTVSSVRVTLLGGSSAVPQIVALVTVDTAGSGEVTVTGSYYGASGSRKVAAEAERWTLSGKTEYQYSVPIANSAYCGTEFHFTISAGGHSDADQTGPGC